MKKFILLALFVPVLVMSSGATDLNALFKQANDLYAKGNYNGALGHYKKIESEGYRSSELYFNIGNCYYKQDSLAQSILYYERARLLNPSDEDILFNLDAANQKTVDRIDKMPVLFIKDWWQRLGATLSLQGWSFLLIICIWGAMTGFVLYIMSKYRIKKIIFFSAASVLLLGGIFIFIIANSQNAHLNKEKEGIILTPTITIKSAPASGKDLFVLHEGTKVRILDKSDGWVKIRLGNGNVGWLPENGIAGI
jgi:tetratricopeptide (TPR) repeat protein